MPRAILHVDMDAFYASVEQRDDPSLKGRPLIVGGHPRRGVVLAASYEVRPFGVRSAMPMARALQLAPQAVVVPPRASAYAEVSEQVFEIFSRFTPLIEPLSLDEAFLDVTASTTLFGPPAGIARQIRQAISEELRLPASAGIAPVKFVAKIASDFAKPNGQKEILPDEVRDFLRPLAVGRLWGVGPKLEETLQGLGLRTVGDLARADASWLERKLGSTGPALRALSLGEDDREVVPDRRAKSIGAEDTFEEDLSRLEALRPMLHQQALRVGRRLRQAGLKARVVQLKLKLGERVVGSRLGFPLITRRATLSSPTDDGQRLYREALALLEREPLPGAVRLTGVAAHELTGGDAQLGLFASGPNRGERLNAALDRIAQKFGAGAVLPADVRGTLAPDDEDQRAIGASHLDRPRRHEP